MQAQGCQPVSVNLSLNLWAFRRALPVAMGAAALLLSACAPLSQSTDGAVATTGEALHGWGVAQPMEDAVHQHLYDLQLPKVDQQGVASWYGPGFHGRKTANGERFNQYELTAAHPTYAFGTQLCVRSKVTGQAVVVRVNDRGPFAKNRVIDLSKAAAEEIGMLDKGVKAVEIYKLGEGEDRCPEAVLQAKD